MNTLFCFSVNRYREKNLKGEIKTFRVKSLPPSQREKLRDFWRNAELKYRTKKRNLHVVMNLTPPTPENSFNHDVEIQPDSAPVQSSTPEHPEQNQESPLTSPSPNPHRAEIEKLKAQLKKAEKQK